MPILGCLQVHDWHQKWVEKQVLVLVLPCAKNVGLNLIRMTVAARPASGGSPLLYSI